MTPAAGRLLLVPALFLATLFGGWWLVDLYLTMPTFEAAGRGVMIDPGCAQWVADWRTLSAQTPEHNHSGWTSLVDLDIEQQQVTLMARTTDIMGSSDSTVSLERRDLRTGALLRLSDPLACTSAFPTADSIVYYYDRWIRRLDVATFEPVEDITLEPGALKAEWNASTVANWDQVVRLPDGDYAGYVRSHSLDFWVRICALPDFTQVSDPCATRVGNQLVLWYAGYVAGPAGTGPGRHDPLHYALVPLPDELQYMPEGTW